METSKASRNRKRAAAVIAVIALLIASLGVTYAYWDMQQHKSNEFKGHKEKYEVRLNESFKPVEDWKVSDGVVTKKINVVNHGRSEKEFGSAFVRIQLKEYMEIGQVAYEQTADRYKLDPETGQFVIYETQAEAEAAVAEGGKYEGHEFTALQDAVTGKSGYFIKTQDGDEDGQMGKHVITDIGVGAPNKVITEGPDRAPTTNHHGTVQTDDEGNVIGIIRDSGECEYIVRSWEDGARLDTRDYVEWQLNEGAIIKMSEWLDPSGQYKGEYIDKWIIDDLTDSGWVYWGQPLDPDGGMTANFLEGVYLIEDPEGSFYYVIHTELEAVSWDELENGNVDWGDAGEQFVDNGKPGGGSTGGEGTDPGDGGEGTDPGDGGEGTDPGEGGDGGEGTDIPLVTPSGGTEGIYKPIFTGDPLYSDGFWLKHKYDEPDHPDVNKIYHIGAFHLEDIIEDGDFAGLTVTPQDPKFGNSIRLDNCPVHPGTPSIVFDYLPTEQEYLEAVGAITPPETRIHIPAKVDLTRADGKTATITLLLYYYGSLLDAKKPKGDGTHGTLHAP
jgi:hypothetical protein